MPRSVNCTCAPGMPVVGENSVCLEKSFFVEERLAASSEDFKRAYRRSKQNWHEEDYCLQKWDKYLQNRSKIAWAVREAGLLSCLGMAHNLNASVDNRLEAVANILEVLDTEEDEAQACIDSVLKRVVLPILKETAMPYPREGSSNGIKFEIYQKALSFFIYYGSSRLRYWLYAFLMKTETFEGEYDQWAKFIFDHNIVGERMIGLRKIAQKKTVSIERRLQTLQIMREEGELKDKVIADLGLMSAKSIGLMPMDSATFMKKFEFVRDLGSPQDHRRLALNVLYREVQRPSVEWELLYRWLQFFFDKAGKDKQAMIKKARVIYNVCVPIMKNKKRSLLQRVQVALLIVKGGSDKPWQRALSFYWKILKDDREQDSRERLIALYAVLKAGSKEGQQEALSLACKWAMDETWPMLRRIQACRCAIEAEVEGADWLIEAALLPIVQDMTNSVEIRLDAADVVARSSDATKRALGFLALICSPVEADCLEKSRMLKQARKNAFDKLEELGTIEQKAAGYAYLVKERAEQGPKEMSLLTLAYLRKLVNYGTPKEWLQAIQYPWPAAVKRNENLLCFCFKTAELFTQYPDSRTLGYRAIMEDVDFPLVRRWMAVKRLLTLAVTHEHKREILVQFIPFGEDDENGEKVRQWHLKELKALQLYWDK